MRSKRVAVLWPTLALACALGAGLSARGEAVPAAPDSPLRRLAGRLAQQKPAPAKAAAGAPDKDALVRPEFQFRPSADWLLLPELAQGLGTTDEERAAVLNLLDQGTREARRLLAAERAENDVAAATALFASELWQVARNRTLPEADVDALHAQIVGAMAGPEVGRMADADKQRYWEFCIGYPVFILGMKEVVGDEAQVADLRKAAALGFESLLGVKPELVDIGPQGLVVRAGLEEAARQTVAEAKAAPGAQPAAAGRSGITYAAPAGWTREEAGWATILRATLPDVDLRDHRRPDPTSSARHAGSIFILPPRAVTGDAHATFDAVWREQLDVLERSDTTVHYRSRLKSGLVVHYMGGFFRRKDGPADQPKNYAVLYLVDLGRDRVQPVVGFAVPNDPGLGMISMKESAALRAVAVPLGDLLDSIRPAAGPAPYPQGGFFRPADLHGDWEQSSSAFGGFYVNARTGAAAGAAVHSAGGSLRISPDGRYEYSFAFATYNPQFGQSGGAERHAGTYRLDGDIFLTQPDQPVRSPLRRCAVGIGTRQTAAGVKRILVMVGADGDGVFRAPPLIPNWDSYDGVMAWYQEK